jgi:beta-galactosidase
MNAIRSLQAGSRASCAMRIAAVSVVAVAAGCGGGYGGGSGGMSATRPMITTQPTSQTVTHPAAAMFTVVASGGSGGYGGSLSYQWMMNGSPIMGATMSSYSTGATTTAESGATFFVTVTNSVGSTDSNMVTLTVN